MISLYRFKEKIKDLYKNEKFPAIILKDNVYHVFGKYNIVDKDGLYELYRNGDYINYVNSSRTAMMWCVADRHIDVVLSNDLIKHDHDVGYTKFNIEVHKQLAEKGSTEQKRLHTDLYYVEIDKLKVLQRKLANCIFLAKYNKIKDFEQ